MYKFPLAVIDAGVFGRKHIERILKTPEFALLGVAADCLAQGIAVLINLIHDIDMQVYLLGKVRAVQGSLSSAVRGFEVEDTGSALLESAGGTQAVMTVSDTAVSPWSWDFCAVEQTSLPEIDVYVQPLRHLRAVAERRASSICSAQDGWRTLQATLALLQAARSGHRQTCSAFTASRSLT